MPVIKARTRGKHIVRYITRLDRENVETLFAYAAFLSEPPEYVLNQLIDTLLAKDKEFISWREANAGPHTPRSPHYKARPRMRRAVTAILGADRAAAPAGASVS
jgi:hypothetical protein